MPQDGFVPDIPRRVADAVVLNSYMTAQPDGCVTVPERNRRRLAMYNMTLAARRRSSSPLFNSDQ